jgi:putative transposase
MGLARSTFYDTPLVPLNGDELLARVGAICDEFECYGYRRVGAALRHQGVVVNGKKLRRLMREHGLQPKQRRRYVVTTDSNHAGPIYPDLAKNLVPDRAASSTWRRSWMLGRARWSATRSADRWMPALPLLR